MPTNPNSQIASITSLGAEHRDIFTQAISAVLSTELAESTYAQILDGLPLADVFQDRYGYHGALRVTHPLRNHTTLCPGVLEKTRQFRACFKPDDITFESKLLQAYQNAPLETREFRMRLIEMTAVAIHNVAVYLFNLDQSLHKNDGVLMWEREPGAGFPNPDPTLFNHPAYTFFEQYPNGAADMAGYWAENRILGGVVLFDRGESGSECKDIYFHSDRNKVTYRIYKLLDMQVETLIDFLLSPDSHTALASPLPIVGDKHNRSRIDPDDAIDEHGVFRDHWERQIPVKDDWYYRSQRDVQNVLDYPEFEDMYEDLTAATRGRPRE